MRALRSVIRLDIRSTIQAYPLRTATYFYSASASSKICSSCSAVLPTALPACPKCFHIEPLPESMSYYDAFELSPSNLFRVDARDLRQRFLQAQRLCHPDVWSRKGEREKGLAEAQSSFLNTAYKTLLSPSLRAQYILSQVGFPTSETDKLSDVDLITEIMDAHEELDVSRTPEEVDMISESNDSLVRLQETYSKLEILISEKAWDAARDELIKLKYLEGIKSAAKARKFVLIG